MLRIMNENITLEMKICSKTIITVFNLSELSQSKKWLKILYGH